MIQGPCIDGILWTEVVARGGKLLRYKLIKLLWEDSGEIEIVENEWEIKIYTGLKHYYCYWFCSSF